MRKRPSLARKEAAAAARPSVVDVQAPAAVDDQAANVDDQAADVDEQAPAAPSDGAQIKAAFKSSARSVTRAGGSWKPAAPHKAKTPGSLLTGAALYVVAITYIRYGRAGWKGWLRAKFLNQPMTKAEAEAAKRGTKSKEQA